MAENTDTKNPFGIDKSSYTLARLTDHTPRKRKLRKQLYTIKKKLKFTREKCEDVTESQFLKGCDKFLSPKLSAIVKAQIYLKHHCKNNRYNREFKLFCLNIYYTSPLAYRFLSKTICLPTKSTLANMYFSMETKINEEVWNILTSTIQHMSSSEKECVLCMDELSLKLNLSYNTKEDKILGLHEVDGQQQPAAAGYAFILMLRGICSKWKQPIDFSFITSSKIDDQLRAWLIRTVKHLLQLGFNIRAFISDLGSDFLALSKTLGICKESSFFEIDGHKMYYIFDVPHLMKCVRNNLINYNFEFDGKIAQWEDIIKMYEQDQKKDMRSAPRLTDAHIHPNSFQKQKVRLAVQVFSNSVVAALKNYESSGSLQLTNGTIDFIETMNNLFDLLNSNNIDSLKPHNKPYRGIPVQEELLDKAQHLFNNMRVINKNNGHDVTNMMKFIKAFNVTINSLRQLYNDMKSQGYKYILTRRINNDCLENFFGLVRQAGGNCREPTCLQYTRAFRKIFLCQILNLSDATNCTEDFDNILTQFLQFTKNRPQAQVCIQNPPEIQPKKKFSEKYDMPEENAFYYICGYLLRRCVENHKRDCLSIVNYASSSAYETNEKKFIHPFESL
ncbi:unnamed protein product [Euphydryas editha]|uniref:Transposable element P transposase n=1 Tax=Euphydryas editha TaxID=104508 RepID=A0AAU9UVG3_EUPED|nr:unnamed protein product [Euphydryas editha]